MHYINRYCRMTLLLIMFYGVIIAGMAGCTFKHVKPEIVTAPTQKYSVIAIGDITMEDKLWDSFIPHFRRGLVQELVEQKVFESVLDSAQEKLSESSVLITGTIKEVDKGSTALRWIVGFGAGRAKVKGIFEIRDWKAMTLAKFEVQESYAGGAGIGGANFLDMEDLTKRFGATIAKRIVQWSQGKKIDE